VSGAQLAVFQNQRGFTAIPGTPTIGTATVTGSTTATVAFTQPASDGGSAITQYRAISSPGNITGTLNQAGSGTITVTGLTTGTAYTFTVRATNAIGNSAESSASGSITTWAVPGTPTVGTATQTGQTTATVAFTAPGSDGGTAITSYRAISSPGGITGTLSQAGSGTITVTGLTGNTAYTFTVRATNSVGNSSESSASNQITTAAVVPGTPTIGTATQTGTTTATVAFTAPGSDGGAAITQYRAISTPGSITGVLNQAGSGTITVTGLTAATNYTFTVRATNSVGNSSESSASNQITTASPAPVGQAAYTSYGSYLWTCPTSVTSVCVVCIGGGSMYYHIARCGGSLGWKNNISVTPGEEYLVSVGRMHQTSPSTANHAPSFFISLQTVSASNGAFSGTRYVGNGGGIGADPGVTTYWTDPYDYVEYTWQLGGGGGAGGYAGNGGIGGDGATWPDDVGTAGTTGSGGGGGGGGGSTWGAKGGGTGLLGQGSSGAGGAFNASGYPGSGGSGVNYGGGGGDGSNSIGAVRIIWGDNRAFPSTNTGNL